MSREESQETRSVVGLFDSGIGGLGLLRLMLEVERPAWDRLLYLADLAHFPYGPRPAAEVRSFAVAGIDLLAGLGATTVVVACNTAASAGVRAGELEAPVPFLDIIGPGARHGAELARRTAAGRVFVLGTEGTVGSHVWERALREAGYSGPLVGWPCPFLAKLIEEGRNGLAARDAVREATCGLGRWPESSGELDIVILGCTHYPFARTAFEEVLTREVLRRPALVVDPAEALVTELVASLAARATSRPAGMAHLPAERPVEVRFLTTGRGAHLRERARHLLADKLVERRARLLLDRVREVGLPGLPPGGASDEGGA